MYLSDQEFLLFKDYIAAMSGVQIPWNRCKSLEVSVLSRMSERGILSFDEYLRALQEHPGGREELETLLSLLVINETCFMRQEYQFRTLSQKVFSELARRKLILKPRDSGSRDKSTLSIWSCGCSTGEEAYSLAITLLESLPFKALWNIELLGTDIDRDALREAAEGVYREKALRCLSEELIARYFTRTEKGYEIKDEVKKMVRFRFHNLMEQPYPTPPSGAWDVIFCRNVLIYFRLPIDNLIIQSFYDALEPNGCLFLGYSETLSRFASDFVLTRDNETFYYQKVPGVKGRHLVQLLDENEKKASAARAEAVETFPLDLLDARRLLEAGDLDGAKAVCENLLVGGSSEDETRLLYARLLLDRGELESALVECEKLLDKDPMASSVYFMKGIIFVNLRLAERAAEQFRKALYLDKSFTMAHYYLAELYQSKGLGKEALRHYRKTCRCLDRLYDGEAPEFAGGFSKQALMVACEKSIENLQTR